jgi:hypothetical protein
MLRGGVDAVVDSAVDVLRLGKMFTDLKTLNGVFFTAKQNLLSRTAVRTQASGILNEGIYTPLSTLAEAGVVAFGGHVNKQGLNPFSETGAYSTNINLYGPLITNQKTLPSAANRLVHLYSNKINTPDISVNVMSYTGGPGSILGIGSTNIRFADQRTGINNAGFSTGKYYGPLTWTPNQNVSPPSQALGTFKTGLSKIKRDFSYNVYQSGSLEVDNIVVTPSTPHQDVTASYAFNNFITGSSKIKRDFSYNVYQSGSLEVDNIVVTPSTPHQDVTASYAFNNFITGSSKIAPNFDVYEPFTRSYTPSASLSVLETNTTPDQNGYVPFTANDTKVYTQAQIVSASNLNGTRGADSYTPTSQDFRAALREKLTKSTVLSKAPSYDIGDNKTVEGRINYGDPGNRTGKNLISYTTGSGIGPIDKINALPLYDSENANETAGNDLVKFRIASINNSNPSLKTYMHFRALINSFSDSYNASWNPVTYLGRGENFYTYDNFTRTINLSWTVAAQSKQELIPMYKKLNYLASNIAPDYTNNGYMAGNLVQLTIGGYLYEQVGIITSLTYDIQDDTTWEIAINDNAGYDPSVKELPHIIRVSNFSFIPIQDFIPRKQYTFGNDQNSGLTDDNEYGEQRFIALNNGANNNYDS